MFSILSDPVSQTSEQVEKVLNIIENTERLSNLKRLSLCSL